MWMMYIIATIPVIITAGMWAFHKEVTWLEWIGSSVISYAIALLFHSLVIFGMGRDIETWSGNVNQVERTPYWHAEWQEMETYTVTVGSGKNQHTETRTRMVTKTESHPPTWTAKTNIGDFSIKETEYSRLKNLFGKESSKKGYRPDMDSGDPLDYYLVNVNNHYEPVNKVMSWNNKIKACPSTFSYPEVPDNEGFSYPENNNTFRSDRLLGTAKQKIDIYNFDCMNARLGPYKKVNVIIIGFSDSSSSMEAQTQEAKWIGGKKNDLVLCSGGNPKWTYVFGWTEEMLVKRNLETILLENEINNEILPKIEAEIQENYKIRDWHQFDYLTVEPPLWSYIVLIIVTALTQIGFMIYAVHNQFDKENSGLINYFKHRNHKRWRIK